MREQLLNSIRLAISTDGATDVEAIEIDSLLDDISGTTLPDDAEPSHESIDDDSLEQQLDRLKTPDPSRIPDPETPPDPDPQN
jgi:hypothetical protein